jgi:serine/threonine protein phosphatase PrpC
MDQFRGLMDTLSLQPRATRELGENAAPVNVTLKPSTFSAQLRNSVNFVGAAFHSMQGRRETQEDRCLLLPDLAAMQALVALEPPMSTEALEQLRKFSVACVFDGHSGWRCAHFLAQQLVPSLVLHERFLDKQPDVALLDTFRAVDEDACRMLRQEDDSSGSTCVAAIYDGRRHVLTVANVGDSMCVLSRGGRAVRLHRMHRVGAEDQAERARVEAAGGSVINNRCVFIPCPFSFSFSFSFSLLP